MRCGAVESGLRGLTNASGSLIERGGSGSNTDNPAPLPFIYLSCLEMGLPSAGGARGGYDTTNSS